MSINRLIDYDVTILGGGISGSLLALNLKKKNPSLRILILDKGQKVSSKVGEATADLSSIFLNRFGINHLLEKQTKKTGLRFIFNEKNSFSKEHLEFASPSLKSFVNGYHLNRAKFDKELLLECEKIGISILCPAELRDIEISSTESEIFIHHKSQDIKLKTIWFIDASGNLRYLKKKLKWKDIEISLNTGAITAHFKNLQSQSWDRGDSSYWTKKAIGSKEYSTTHFLKPYSWWWLIKLDENTSSIGVVYDKNYIKFDNADTFFNDSIKKDSILSKVTKNAKHSKINHISSLPYISSKLHHDNVAVIGDSGAFIDPLFSPGLELICQQNEYLTFLLLDYFKNQKKNIRAWNKYENVFLKTYKDRAYVYNKLYNFMHSYDLFSNATQLLFFGYQTFAVLPLKYFHKKIKIPKSFKLLDRLVIDWVFNRFIKISIKRKIQKRFSTSIKHPIYYSHVGIPNGILYFFKPIQLAFLWLINYLKIEISEIYYFKKE